MRKIKLEPTTAEEFCERIVAEKSSEEKRDQLQQSERSSRINIEIRKYPHTTQLSASLDSLSNVVRLFSHVNNTSNNEFKEMKRSFVDPFSSSSALHLAKPHLRSCCVEKDSSPPKTLHYYTFHPTRGCTPPP